MAFRSISLNLSIVYVEHSTTKLISKPCLILSFMKTTQFVFPYINICWLPLFTFYAFHMGIFKETIQL